MRRLERTHAKSDLVSRRLQAAVQDRETLRRREGNEGMEPLIPIINKLQDVFNAIGQSPLDLPQIVVIGSQSSGKSSVLESIVGREFLPRGTGVVTRRPLVIQLYNTKGTKFARLAGSPRQYNKSKDGSSQKNDGDNQSSNSSSPHNNNNNNKDNGEGNGNSGRDGSGSNVDEFQEWGEFLHLPGKKFFDFNEIRREIMRETDKLTGKNYGISSKSINLKIFSPNVLTLSLVDLPGITKVPVGDQPSDIEAQVREMCMRYIRSPTCIILGVTAANTDLANSDALQMAREVDSSGKRTIGVLTKLDLMDPGTDAMDMLSGRVIPLQRGYVGVINRSQADIKANVSIRQSLAKENAFFQNHSAYRPIATRMGSQFLTKMLNQILMQHIRECLPDLKSRIASMLVELDAELMGLGTPFAASDRTGKSEQLLHLISKFSTNFGNAIEGRSFTANGGSSSTAIETNELYGGARISYIFNEVYSRAINQVDPFSNLSDEDIRTAIRNATGTRATLFVPEVAFELLVKAQIKRLEGPALQCIDLVYDELKRVASQCEQGDIQRFSQLRDAIVDVVNSMLRDRVVPTQRMVSDLIEIELAHINTSHPDFIGGSRAVSELMGKMQAAQEASHGAAVSSGAGPGPSARRNPAASRQSRNSSKGRSDSGGRQTRGDVVSNKVGFFGNIFGHTDPSNGAPQTPTEQPSSVVKLPQMPSSVRASSTLNEKETVEVEIIKSLISSYFDIVRKNIGDMVPKSVMCFLVNYARQNVQSTLVQRLYRDSSLDELLRETDDTAQRRRNCVEVRGLLRRALEIVNEVRDFNAFGSNSSSM